MVRIMMEQVRLCKNCDSKVIGRKDRKYCSSNCRKRYSENTQNSYSSKLYWRLQLLTFFAVMRSCRPRPSVKAIRPFWGAFVSRIIFSLSFNSTPIWGYFRATLGLLYSIKIGESLKGLSELHMCNMLMLLHICSKSKRKSLIRPKSENMEQLICNQWVGSSSLSGAPFYTYKYL